MEFLKEWYEGAREAQKRAYTPYSKFNVGAYLITKDGKTYYGANIENAAYPSTICAERSALVAAMSDGYRPGDFKCITITVDADEPSSPCDDDMPVFLTNQTEERIETTVNELLPLGFSGKDLG